MMSAVLRAQQLADESTAHHECAHAALATHCGFAVHHINLRGRETTFTLPFARHELRERYQHYPYLTTRQTQQIAMVYLGGYLAQDASSAGTCDESDLALWAAAWKRLPSTAKPWRLLEAHARCDALEFLLAPTVAYHLDRMARVLCRERVLTGPRLEGLLQCFAPPAASPRPIVKPAPKGTTPARKTYHFSTPSRPVARPQPDLLDVFLPPSQYDWRSGWLAPLPFGRGMFVA